MTPNPTWRPTEILRWVAAPLGTSTGATLAETDATLGFVKALGNREGEHALASEFVASSLATWFGLSVPEFAIVRLRPEMCSVTSSESRKPGPAFVSRKWEGRCWDGSAEGLAELVNPDDVTRLVVFDTWVRNRDRYSLSAGGKPRANYANVFLAGTSDSNQYRLCAIDHTHCFDNVSEFTPKLADIGRQRDDRTFGLFPAFERLIRAELLSACRDKLLALQRPVVKRIVEKIPAEWQVGNRQRTDLVEFILQRAAFIADRINEGWQPANAPVSETRS